jgi:hypothetical protein
MSKWWTGGLLAAVILVAGVAAAAVLSGAADLQGSARQQVLSYSEPMTDNLMAGFNAADYGTVARDFNATMKTGLDVNGFLASRSQILTNWGRYLSRSVDRVHTNGDYVTVYYHARFSTRDATMTVSFERAQPHLISGWYVRN